jgi:hypothetical protein
MEIRKSPVGPGIFSRHDGTAAATRPAGFVEDGFGKVVVVLTDVLEHLKTFGPSQVEAARPRSRVCAGIIDSHFVLQRPGVRP